MRKTIFAIAVCIIMVSVLAVVAFAGDAVHFDVKARITSSTAVTVNIAKVVGSGTSAVFTWGQSAVDFGQLSLDTANNVYRPADGGYYAVDVSANNNTGSWTLLHTTSPVNLQGSTANPIPTLSDKINVTFVKQPTSTNLTGTASTLTGGYLSYANSNSFQVTSGTIGTGYYLRIYYGIGTGTTGEPAVAVPATQPSGNYVGQVTLTIA
jgi:hypothetical protein